MGASAAAASLRFNFVILCSALFRLIYVWQLWPSIGVKKWVGSNLLQERLGEMLEARLSGGWVKGVVRNGA